MKITSWSLIFMPLTLALVISCATENNRMRGKYEVPLPGAYPINDTLFCDQTEITNFQWLEYLFWTERCFGVDSEAYKNALPQDSIWQSFNCLKERDADKYFRSPQYRNFPVVGLNQQQARDFANWRSDRVFEYLLIKKGILDFDATQDFNRYFTIEKYFNGEHRVHSSTTDSTQFRNIVPDMSILYPEYRLPTLEDRSFILDYVDSTEFLYHKTFPKEEAKAIALTPLFQMAIQPCDTSKIALVGSSNVVYSSPMRDVEEGVQEHGRISILYNTRGNAAEWLEEPNLTVGGGWPHNVKYVMINDSITANKANAWTGFRCVAQWKKYKP